MDAQSNHILLVSIHHLVYPITVEVLHQIFDPYGFVEDIVPIQSSASFQALVQFQSRVSATSALKALNGRNIYDDCCRLDIQIFIKLLQPEEVDEDSTALHVAFNGGPTRETDMAESEVVEYAKKNRGADINFEKSSSIGRTTQVEVAEPEKLNAENAPGNQSVEFESLDKLDVKIDTDTTIPILLFGGGALVSIWLTSAVVEAIDAIPVVPKLMEVVGLTYTIWFTSRYLIFKEGRDELATKIAELETKILGSERN